MNEQPDLPLGERINRTMNLSLFVAAALAFPAIVFLHRDLGRRFAGGQAMLSVALIFFWPILDPTNDPLPMFYFLGLFLLMCFTSRVQGLRRKVGTGGDPVHRFYNGYPRLMRFFRVTDEVRFKRLHEPVVVFWVGGMLGVYSPPLAFFLWASAVALAITASATEIAAHERAESMRDQLIEQQLLAERFRRLGGR